MFGEIVASEKRGERLGKPDWVKKGSDYGNEDAGLSAQVTCWRTFFKRVRVGGGD
jgi:hypothetical protein